MATAQQSGDRRPLSPRPGGLMMQGNKRRKLKKLRIPKVDKFKFYDLVIYAARGSHAARRLASALSCRRWRDDLPERYTKRRPYFRGNRSPLVINWGSTVPAAWLEDPRFRLTPNWINSAKAVSVAIDKSQFFGLFDSQDEIPVLKATASAEIAERWLKKGFGVVARKTTTGSGGAGIVVVQPGQQLLKAPLYTRYYPKTHEFRAHVFDGKLIDFTQKKLKGGPNESANRIVRSLSNGWIHAHDDLDISQAGIEIMGKGAISCLRSLGLTFGAVDILACLSPERALNSYRICEVNTGPGLENQATINAYASAVMAKYKELKGIKVNVQ